MEFKNVIIAAPMVRVSTLPFRELCLEYGANIAYTEVLFSVLQVALFLWHCGFIFVFDNEYYSVTNCLVFFPHH